MKTDEVKYLIEQTYWAKDRSLETIIKSMENSVCYGVLENKSGRQVGFARVVTDFAAMYYLCDVIIDSNFRGQGLGKKLLEEIVNDEDFCNLRGILAT